jgi:hypothetical protein
MFEKTHNEISKSLISKPGKLNPMFGKTHSEKTKQLISLKISKTPIGLYDVNHKLIPKFNSQIELAKKNCFFFYVDK